jgi:hypothetical protein
MGRVPGTVAKVVVSTLKSVVLLIINRNTSLELL